MKRKTRYKDYRPKRSNRLSPKRNPWKGLIRLAVSAVFLFIILNVCIWAAKSPHFQIKEISIQGLNYSSEEAVRGELNSVLGENIFRAKLKSIEKKLENHPWVEQARIYRSIPSGLQVQITERRPLALLNTSGSLIIVDFEGNLLTKPLGGQVYDLPLINGGSCGGLNYLEAVNFLRAAQVLAPLVYSQISEVFYAREDKCLTALMGKRATRIKIGENGYREKVFKLWILINKTDIRLEQIKYADMRFSGKIFLSRG